VTSRAGKTLAALVPLALIAVLGWNLSQPHPGPAPQAAPSPPPPVLRLCRSTGCYRGVDLAEQSRARLAAWVTATQVPPTIVEVYQRLSSPFPARWAAYLTARGILPLIQLDPRQGVAPVLSGADDGHLRSFAAQIARAHMRVALSFGHEMNGDWYPWGFRHTRPADFITAWRRVHDLLASPLVTWVWTVNHVYGGPGSSPVARWWPGAPYVDWVGLDAYFEGPQATFRRIFRPTLRQIRRVTSKPVLLTETATGPWLTSAQQIRSLFDGIRQYHLLGLLWYDQDGRRPWYLDNRPQDLATFRQESQKLKESS
jgi:hypothetical protein